MTDATKEPLLDDGKLTSDTISEKSPIEHQTTQKVFRLQHYKSKVDYPLVCFCMVNFLLNAAVSVITPFYPPMAAEAGFSVSVIGYVFAIQPVGSFMFSFFIGAKMNKWGRKNCMVIGLTVQCIALTAFGFLERTKDNYALLLGLSLTLRFLQGVSRAAYSAISFAYVPILWPNSIQQKISIMESLTGLGMMGGPFLGSGLYYLVGYQWVFYIMGIMLSLSIPPTMIYLPNDNKEVIKKQTFNGAKVLLNRNVLSLALVVTMTSAGTTFINPMFSLHMKTYDISEGTSSLLMGTLTISYVFFINFVPKLVKIFDKRGVLTAGIIISAIGDLIIAPVMFLPQKWWMVLIGLPVIGIANALCVLPAIPQFVEFISKIHPEPEHKRQIGDMSSGLFVGSYSFGILVGPLAGGQIYQLFLGDSNQIKDQQHSFMWSSMIIALVQFMLAFAFYLITTEGSCLFGDKKATLVKPINASQSVMHPSSSVFSDQVYSDRDPSLLATDVKRSTEQVS